MFPISATGGAVYIVRNPLDVAVSLAHYNCISMTRAVDILLRSDSCLGKAHTSLRTQFPQHLGDWAFHVNSWLTAPFRVHVVRYEDLVAGTELTFGGVAQFLKRREGPEEICRAVRDSAFHRLRSHEEKAGFRGNSGSGNKFFRRGIVGAWREELPTEQAARIIEKLGPAMQRLGY
jgi:hypothetical protein